MTNKTILVPTTTMIDPNFLEYAKSIATEQDAKLVILYVTSPLTLTNYYTYPSMLYSIANLNLDSVNAAHENFSHIAEEMLGDFPHEIVCLIGPTTDTILSVADKKQADMIIVAGPPQVSGKFMVKQKSDKLAKKTSIPVIVYEG